ncbi:MAG: hypothetical protein O3B01_27575 [Planctomycetota bacterium]|nr:hypothetical protein [Planctomycetota bacterium]
MHLSSLPPYSRVYKQAGDVQDIQPLGSSLVFLFSRLQSRSSLKPGFQEEPDKILLLEVKTMGIA